MPVQGLTLPDTLTQADVSEFPVVTERRLVILRYAGKTPSFAECACCHLKFFTPPELNKDPVRAEENLRHKFDTHKCKDEGRRDIR